MPDTLEKAYGYHIYFWSNEGEPLEPVHIHISKTPHPNATKYWLLQDGTLLQENNNDNIPENELKRIITYVSLERNLRLIKEKWLIHFGEIKYLNKSERK